MEVIEGIEIPNNEIELERVKDKIDLLKIVVKQHEAFETLTVKEYKKLNAETVKILFHLADLSIPAFDIQDKLEEQYFRMYKHSPILAGELFEKKYHSIHKQYNLYKNRCFTLLETLDILYEESQKECTT